MIDTQKLRQRILDLAIRGKLVPQDPNDEPASVLLEKIRAEKERLIAEGKIKRPKAKKTSDKSHYEDFVPPFDIPDSWEWVTLEDICELLSGRDLEINQCNSENKGIPYLIGASNIVDGIFKFIRWTDSPQVISTTGDVLISCKGTIGELLINDYGDIHIARQFMAVRSYRHLIDYNFLLVAIEWSLDSIKEQANGIIPGISRPVLLELNLPIPPFTEQKRIVNEVRIYSDYLKSVSDNIDSLKASILKIKSTILDLAMQGKLVEQDLSDEPAAEMLRRINPKAKIITDNPHSRNIPQGWCVCELKDLCEFLSRGKSPKYSNIPNQYPVFAQKCNLKEGGISLSQARFLDETTLSKWSDKYKLKTGDVLINSTGTGTVGRTRFFDESCLGDYPFVVPDSHVSVVRTFDGICSEYVFYYLYSDTMQQYFEDNLAGSTNQKELYIDIIGKSQIYLPPYNEQCRIVTSIQQLYSGLDEIEASLQS